MPSRRRYRKKKYKRHFRSRFFKKRRWGKKRGMRGWKTPRNRTITKWLPGSAASATLAPASIVSYKADYSPNVLTNWTSYRSVFQYYRIHRIILKILIPETTTDQGVTTGSVNLSTGTVNLSHTQRSGMWMHLYWPPGWEAGGSTIAAIESQSTYRRFALKPDKEYSIKIGPRYMSEWAESATTTAEIPLKLRNWIPATQDALTSFGPRWILENKDGAITSVYRFQLWAKISFKGLRQ